MAAGRGPPQSWDTDPENFQPLAHGRNVAVHAVTHEEAVRLLQEQLRVCGDDPLRAWVKYLQVLRESVYPSGHESITQTLEQVADQFKFDPQYKNDPRFLKVMLELASKQVNASEVLDFMEHHEICVGLPKFHIAVAAEAERRGDFTKAEAAYKRAVRYAEGRRKGYAKGTPEYEAAEGDIKYTTSNLSQFQRRMARKQINSSKQTERAFHGISPTSASRTAVLNAQGKIQAKPFNIFQGPPTAPAGDNAAWMHIPLAHGPENVGPPQPWGAGFPPVATPATTSQGGSSASALLRPAASGASAIRVAAPFPVFRDEPAQQQPASAALAEKKDPFSVWSRPAGPAVAPAAVKPVALGPSVASLVADRLAEMNLESAGPRSRFGALPPPQPSALSSGALPPPSILPVKPVMATPAPPIAAAAAVASAPPPPPPMTTMRFNTPAEPDYTINTRLAFDAMYDVFGSPSMRQQQQSAPATTEAVVAPPSFFTPAPPPQQAGGGGGPDPENWSPNAALPAATSTRRPLGEVQERPPLSLLVKRDELAAPSFRALLSSSSNRPSAPPKKEDFMPYSDSNNETVMSIKSAVSRRADDHTMQGTLGSLGLTETLDRTVSSARVPVKPSFQLFSDLDLG